MVVLVALSLVRLVVDLNHHVFVVVCFDLIGQLWFSVVVFLWTLCFCRTFVVVFSVRRVDPKFVSEKFVQKIVFKKMSKNLW